MFSILFRRLQKYLSGVKVLVLIASLGGVGFLVFNTQPTVATILVVGILIFCFLMTLFSVFVRTKTAFLVSLSASFILFLKAVDLLTILNLGLLALLIVFLVFYLYKQPVKR